MTKDTHLGPLHSTADIPWLGFLFIEKQNKQIDKEKKYAPWFNLFNQLKFIFSLYRDKEENQTSNDTNLGVPDDIPLLGFLAAWSDAQNKQPDN